MEISVQYMLLYMGVFVGRLICEIICEIVSVVLVRSFQWNYVFAVNLSLLRKFLPVNICQYITLGYLKKVNSKPACISAIITNKKHYQNKKCNCSLVIRESLVLWLPAYCSDFVLVIYPNTHTRTQMIRRHCRSGWGWYLQAAINNEQIRKKILFLLVLLASFTAVTDKYWY